MAVDTEANFCERFGKKTISQVISAPEDQEGPKLATNRHSIGENESGPRSYYVLAIMILHQSKQSRKYGLARAGDQRRSFERLRVLCGIALLFRVFYALCASSSVAGQAGFVSIDCGNETNYTDSSTGLSWTSDAGYVQTGTSLTVNVTKSPSYYPLWNPNQLPTLRFFDQHSRDCYVVKTDRDSKYLVRVVFFHGDLKHTEIGPPSFKVYLNGSFWMEIDFTGYGGDWNTALMFFSWSREAIVYSPGGELNFCLVRNLGGGPSFISTLEFRKLDNGMYNDVVNSSNVQFLDLDLNGLTVAYYNRLNFGETDDKKIIRYPEDIYDRIWRPYPGPESMPRISDSNASRTPSSAAPDQPPTSVTSVGWVYYGGNATMWYGLPFPSTGGEDYALVYVSAYFQELDGNASATNVRGMNFNINDKFITSFNSSYDVTEIHGPVQNITGNHLNISLHRADWSRLEPILNAAEIYNVRPVNASKTSSQDVDVLRVLQKKLALTDWTGDPCVPLPFDWLSCAAEDSSYASFRVTNVTLGGRGMSGPFPLEIFNLTALTTLSLCGNDLTDNLTQYIRDFQSLVHLQTLNLENNSLNGSIPEFETLSNLTVLKLGYNDLTGEIPDFGGPVQLKTLYLQHNKLIGRIPRFEALSNLTQLSVDNNQLSGEVPANLVDKAGLNFSWQENNADLRCSACDKRSGPSRTSTILGGVLGGFAGAVLTVWIMWMLCTKERRARDRIIKNMFKAAENPSEINSLIFKRRAPVGTITVLSLKDVNDATRKFSRKIGSGAFGPVYHGNLPSGQEVAVKVKSANSRQGMNEFRNEVDLLSRIHHRNLVSLVGYCGEAEQQILVTVFLPNGTLRSHLSADQSPGCLDWKTRLDIALNAAKGINYLHTDCAPRIIHRDIKSSNILLDEAMVAKVADFGISKQTPEGTTCGVDTALKGTLGYIDPEYFSSQRLTPKSDVYSFGVVLLELISGRHPLLSGFPDGSETLLEWAEKSFQAERHADLIDPSMRGEFKHESVMIVLSLALSSTARASAHRPDMAHIVSVLNEAIKIEHSSHINSSENSPPRDHSSIGLPKTRAERKISFLVCGNNWMNLMHQEMMTQHCFLDRDLY